jgi:hypothetical protein
MEISPRSTATRRRREPWFAMHPALALSVATLLFVGVLVLQLAVDGSSDSISTLYVLPVALVGFAFGLRAGILAGVLAVVLEVLWVSVNHLALTPLGCITRVVPVLLLGALVGESSDRIRAARESERFAYEMALLHRDAAEVNDSVVQGLAAAKWLLESGQVDRAADVVDEVAAIAQGLVSRVLGADSALPADVRQAHTVMRHAELKHNTR